MANKLGTRMKCYEAVSASNLMKRTPTIIRIDGKAFHTFTRGFKKPFDMIMVEAMWETSKYLCANIQGCKLAYTQSDEISLLLTDYENIDTCSWFDGNVQKIISVSASMATLAFNKFFNQIYNKYLTENKVSDKMKNVYEKKIFTALFDSRVFTIPKEEVCNYFIWRQQDATRNSIQMLGRANFGHSLLNKKSCNEIQEMLFTNKGINWNDIPVYQKRGACIVKKNYIVENKEHMSEAVRSMWVTDEETPIFSQGKYYIEEYI